MLFAAFVLFMSGCGEDRVIIEKPTPVKVEVPEKIAVEQPVMIAEPVKVIVVDDPTKTRIIDVRITWAGWTYGSSMGLFQFIVQGEIYNNHDRPVAIIDILLKVNGKELVVKKKVMPDVIPPHSKGWYFSLRSDDTVFYPKTHYELVFRVEER